MGNNSLSVSVNETEIILFDVNRFQCGSLSWKVVCIFAS